MGADVGVNSESGLAGRRVHDDCQVAQNDPELPDKFRRQGNVGNLGSVNICARAGVVSSSGLQRSSGNVIAFKWSRLLHYWFAIRVSYHSSPSCAVFCVIGKIQARILRTVRIRRTVYVYLHPRLEENNIPNLLNGDASTLELNRNRLGLIAGLVLCDANEIAT